MDTFERKLLSLEVLRAIAQTPAPVSLEDAVKFGDARLVQLLIINDVDNVSIDTFYIACNLGQTEIVRLILDLPQGKSFDMDDAFQNACYDGHTDIVRLLLDLPLERGLNLAAIDNAALRDACACGHTDIVRMLLDLPLERGVNPAALNNRSLRNACFSGHT